MNGPKRTISLLYPYNYWLQMQFILIGDNTQDDLISQFGYGVKFSRSIGKWLTVIIWQKKEIESSRCVCMCLRKTFAGSFHENSISILIIIPIIVILILQNIHKRVYIRNVHASEIGAYYYCYYNIYKDVMYMMIVLHQQIYLY